MIGERLQGTEHGFVVEAVLGEGGFGITYRARREPDGLAVVAKTLRMERLDEWKSLELFERETKVLRALDHANIPDYIDSFSLPTGLVMIQELVEGKDLARRQKDGERLDEQTMLGWFTQMLEVLAYLHGLAPPVIHRDVTPKNVILRPDGTAFLVDFGCVQAAFRAAEEVASTSAGTFGYAPMEQFMGRALPASDLYGLAMTYLAVATGSEPEDLPVDGVRVDVRQAFHGDARMVLLLEAMTEPDPRKRLGSAREALERIAPLVARRKPVAAPAPVVAPVAVTPVAVPKKGKAPRAEMSHAELLAAAAYVARTPREAIWKAPALPKLSSVEEVGLARDGSVVIVENFTLAREVALRGTPTVRNTSLEKVRDDFLVRRSDGTGTRRALSPDGTILASSKGGDVRVGPPGAPRKTAQRLQADASRGLEFTPDGAWLVCSGPEGTKLFGRAGETLESNATAVHHRPDGRAAAEGRGQQVRVGALRPPHPLLEGGTAIRLAETVQGVRFSHDGGHLAILDEAGTLTVVEIAADGRPGAIRVSSVSAGKEGALVGFLADPPRVVAHGPLPGGGAGDTHAVLLWNLAAEYLGALGLVDGDDKPIAITPEGFWSRLGDSAGSGPWTRDGVAARALAEAVPAASLVSDEARVHLADVALRTRFLGARMGGGSRKAAARLRAAVDAAVGLTHVLPLVEQEAARQLADQPRFGAAAAVEMTPEALIDALKALGSRPAAELSVLHEDLLGAREAAEREAAEAAARARAAEEETRRREAERRAEEARAREVAAEKAALAEASARRQAAEQAYEAGLQEEAKMDGRWLRRKDYGGALAHYRRARELGHADADAAVRRLEEKLR